VHLYPIDIQKMNTPTDIDILIIRLFSDEANPDEKKKIAEWLNQSSENTKLYTDLREIWLASGIQSNADNYHLEDVIHNFREQIRRRKYQDENQINLRQFLKYAAIFVLILAFSFSYYRVNLNNNSAFSSTTISCDFGDKSNIILPDGSIVWLNSGSKLTFNADFKSEGRNVFLEGEAFFSVSKNKFHPFRVRTADVDIEVLGTKFNVKAYPEEKLVSTTLVEGSLKISGQNQTTGISPNQKVVFSKESKKMALLEMTDTNLDTEWKEGRFVFRNESLEELAPKLQRWFDVDIIFADERVKQRRFTGVLKHESILEVISYFDLSNFVECRIKGNKIIIKSENN
jgi:ferric-dicitrate binding protein FerR (iron transport regulator)